MKFPCILLLFESSLYTVNPCNSVNLFTFSSVICLIIYQFLFINLFISILIS